MADKRLGSVFIVWVRHRRVATKDRQQARFSRISAFELRDEMFDKYPGCQVFIDELIRAEDGALTIKVH